jgi:hypothetical protein
VTLSTSRTKDTPKLLVETTFTGPLWPGIRVESPHPGCAASLRPFVAAKQLVTRDGTVIVHCFGCHRSYRSVAS